MISSEGLWFLHHAVQNWQEAIGVFAYQTYSAFSRSAFSLHQTVHGNDWLCTEAVHAWLFVAAVAANDSCITSLFQGWWTSKSQLPRPRPNDELFMRRMNSVSQVYERIDVWFSWVRLNEFGSSNTIRRIERLKSVSGTNVDFHMHATK